MRLSGRISSRKIVALATVALVVVSAVWWCRLWGLPNIGDPFDVDAADTVTISESENAYVDYSSAARLIGPWSDPIDSMISASKRWWELPAEARAWMDKNQEALEIWRRGTERPGALYHQPKDVRFNTVLNVDQELRRFTAMAGLRGSQLQEQGDLAGAWGWYRAMLRCSRHVGMHGVIVERAIGKALHDQAAARTKEWANDRRTQTALLRQALDETIAIEAMTAHPSEALKIEYLMFMAELDHPDGMPRLANILRPQTTAPTPTYFGANTVMALERSTEFLKYDPERIRRVVRLLHANWLAQCDRPRHLRAPIASRSPLIYASDDRAPAGARALPPARLAQWCDSTRILKDVPSAVDSLLSTVDDERRQQTALIASLAEQLFVREHGRRPNSPDELSDDRH